MSDDEFPRWLIDDTAGIGDARVFVVHLAAPRFIGELLPDDDEGGIDTIQGITISAPEGQVVCRIEWLDDPVFDADELCRSLAAALRNHWAVRGSL